MDLKLKMSESKYIKESELLELKWLELKPGLAKISCEQKRKAISVLLENQSLMNSANFDSFLNSKSLDLVFEVYSRLRSWDLISIQPLLGPAGLVWHYDKSEISALVSEDIVAYTRKLKRQLCLDFGAKDAGKDIAKELDSEFLTDLWNNAGTVSCVNLAHRADKNEAIEEGIENLISHLKDKSNIPTWCVINSDLYYKYPSSFLNFDTRLKLIPFDDIDGILLGRKGLTHFESGYVYSPYVPFTSTPNYETDVTSLLHRYGKKLMRTGAAYYGRLNVIEAESK